MTKLNKQINILIEEQLDGIDEIIKILINKGKNGDDLISMLFFFYSKKEEDLIKLSKALINNDFKEIELYDDEDFYYLDCKFEVLFDKLEISKIIIKVVEVAYKFSIEFETWEIEL